MRAFVTFILLIASIHAWSQISFAPPFKIMDETQWWFRATAIGDINNDGLNDLLVGSWFNSDEDKAFKILLYKQTRYGTLSSPEIIDYPRSDGVKVIQVVDMNNDHLNDILIGYSDSIGIFYQKSSGGLGKIQSKYSGFSVNGLKTGDLNNDGLRDIAVCHFSSSLINVFTQTLDGNLTSRLYSVRNAGYSEIDVADINGDKLDDIICIPSTYTFSALEILYQRPEVGINNTVFTYRHEELFHPHFNGIGIGDLNNDGYKDIVASNGSNDPYAKLILMYQDSTEAISSNILEVQAYDIPTPVEIEDLNLDGKNEIIVGHHAWNSVTVFESDASYQFKDYLRFDAAIYIYPYNMAVGDLNNDNLKDIAMADDRGNIYILYNRSKVKSTQETSVINFLHLTDTTTTILNFTIPIIDPSPNCKTNRILQRIITKTSKNDHFSGDSITVIKSNTTDTLKTHFNYTLSNDLSVDTVETIINKDSLSVSSGSLMLDPGNSNFLIYSNVCWKIAVDNDWLTVNKNKGEGDEVISLTALPNNTKAVRIGVITITGADTIVRKIEIIQPPGVENPQLNTIKLSLFPNPAQDQLTFLFSNYTFEGVVEIYDVKGIKLFSQFVSKEISALNIENLVSGMYFLKFNLPNGFIVQKFIKV